MTSVRDKFHTNTHLLKGVVRVICLAWPPWGVDHHEVQHTIAAELVEALLANRLFGAVREGTKGASTPARPWVLHKGVIHEPVDRSAHAAAHGSTCGSRRAISV